MYALLKSGEISQATFDEFDPQITQMDADYKKGEKNIYPQITRINYLPPIKLKVKAD
jgi:hypothetical protein